MLHKNVQVGDLHYIQNWEVADYPSLIALTPVQTDIGKVARQLDSGAFYLLTNLSPLTWIPLDNSVALKKLIASQHRLRAAVRNHPFSSILAWKNF